MSLIVLHPAQKEGIFRITTQSGTYMVLAEKKSSFLVEGGSHDVATTQVVVEGNEIRVDKCMHLARARTDRHFVVTTPVVSIARIQ